MSTTTTLPETPSRTWTATTGDCVALAPGDHAVHLYSIDRAMALLVDSDLVAELVCDGSCGGDGSAGLSSCSLAPVDGLPKAA